MTNTSQATSQRELADLVEKEALFQLSGSGGTSYEIDWESWITTPDIENDEDVSSTGLTGEGWLKEIQPVNNRTMVIPPAFIFLWTPCFPTYTLCYYYFFQFELYIVYQIFFYITIFWKISFWKSFLSIYLERCFSEFSLFLTLSIHSIECDFIS